MGNIEESVVLLIASAITLVVARWIRLSYILALLLLGLGLGAFSLVEEPALSSDIILLLFLPPLIFEAAFVLRPRRLWSVGAGVGVLAVPGVLLAMIIGGAIIHWGLGLDWTFALLFGAMVAATDPVAVLATFRQLRADKRLTTLVEGESLLNDGVALALLVTLTETVDDGFRLGSAIGMFLLSIVGGTMIGLVIGWLGHFLIALVDDHLTEMSVSVALAYGSFLAADQLHLSGVLATVTAAMTLGHLGRTRGWVFSDSSERLITDFWEFLAFVANAALFLVMGLIVQASGLLDHPKDVLIGIIAALVGRAVVSYGLGGQLRRIGFPLSRPEQHMLFWGGLRGAVALAAALSLPSDFPHREQLLAMTYGAVLFTILVQGLTIAPIGRRLGILEQAPRPIPTFIKEHLSP
jgi:CPA1 family monovalent cation:H+ antiporter